MKNETFWITLAIILVGIFIFLPSFMPWSVSNYPGYTMMGMMSGSIGAGMALFWILLIVFLILGSLWLGQQLSQQKRR